MVWAMSELREIFDRGVLRHHRDRAAAGIADHDFLFREVAERLLDRLDDVRRRFPLALDLGCHHGVVAELLAGRGGVETLMQADLSPAMTRPAAARGGAALEIGRASGRERVCQSGSI